MQLIRGLQQRFSVTSLGVAVTLTILTLASCWVIDSDTSASLSSPDYNPVAKAKSGDLEITVTESGILEARQSVSLSSELPSNQAKILYLADEGSLVAEGDVIARFDPSPIEEHISQLESDILEARAIIQQSKAELILLEADARSKIARLERQMNAAKLKLESFQSTDYPNRRAEAEKKLQAATAAHDHARRELATEKKLLEKGLTGNDAVQEALDHAVQAETELDIVSREYRNLIDVVLPAEREEARLGYQHSMQELENFRNIIHKQKVIKQEADITRYETRLTDLRQSLEQAGRHLHATTLKAPVPGQLLFKRISIGNEKRRVQVGDSLWNRQQFAELPDMSSMVARLTVREGDISRIRENQAATIYPQAYPDLQLAGTVEAIGTIASGKQRDNSNHFAVRVSLDEVDPRLRPGMTAKVVIHARQYRDTVFVPVESVFYVDQRPVCFLWRNGRPRAVPVSLGDSDGKHVAILSGLESGDEVMLVFPDDYSS